MPTLNPRLSVTLEPSTDAVLRRLSELTGQSKSSIVSEILHSSEQIFERMVITLQAAEKIKANLSAVSIQGFEEGEKRLHEQLGIALDAFDTASKPILDQAEAISRRAPPATAVGLAPPALRPAATAALPPYVTRGSGTPNDENITTKSKARAISAGASKPIKTALAASKRKARG